MQELHKYIFTCLLVAIPQVNHVYAVFWAYDDDECFVNMYTKMIEVNCFYDGHLTGICITVLNYNGNVSEHHQHRIGNTAVIHIKSTAYKIFDLGSINSFPFPELLL